jgi:preprotein translocase subunit SecG
MSYLVTIILTVQMISAISMIGLILIQHGKGADMGASFGSGASGSLFGASGSANFLSRSTAVCATVFFCCTIFLVYLSSRGGRSGAESILDKPSISASAPGSVNSGGSSQIPGAAPGLATDASAASKVADTPASGAATIPTK